jgi:hypothetical protein
MIQKTPPLEIYWEEAEDLNESENSESENENEDENEELEMKVYDDVEDDEDKVEAEGFKEEACTSKSSQVQQL